MDKQFQSFAEFYPFYLSEHTNTVNRRLHFFGKISLLLVAILFLLTWNWLFLMAIPLVGYGFSWTGHFLFEQNKPAAFSNPLYSFIGDCVMAKDILSRKVKF
jgi:hypothetical protein